MTPSICARVICSFSRHPFQGPQHHHGEQTLIDFPEFRAGQAQGSTFRLQHTLRQRLSPCRSIKSWACCKAMAVAPIRSARPGNERCSIFGNHSFLTSTRANRVSSLDGSSTHVQPVSSRYARVSSSPQEQRGRMKGPRRVRILPFL